MRNAILTVLSIVLIFGAGYIYYVAVAQCPVPLAYHVGHIDEQFNITHENAKLAALRAESVWEDATGQNLFSYDEDSNFTINFVFDDRQAFSDAENEYKERLDETASVNETISEQYENLVTQYNTLQLMYADEAEAYERALAAYNTKVQQYNDQGGAPPKAYAELEKEKDELDAEQESLNQLANKLNTVVKEINEVGSEGNRLIETYNRGVDVYNKTFGESREFTQGEYQGNVINVYTFVDIPELELVLAHEFGHALHLKHVAGEASIMYYMIGGQPASLDLSAYDLNEFARVCGEHSLWDRIEGGIQSLFTKN